MPICLFYRFAKSLLPRQQGFQAGLEIFALQPVDGRGLAVQRRGILAVQAVVRRLGALALQLASREEKTESPGLNAELNSVLQIVPSEESDKTPHLPHLALCPMS